MRIHCHNPNQLHSHRVLIIPQVFHYIANQGLNKIKDVNCRPVCFHVYQNNKK